MLEDDNTGIYKCETELSAKVADNTRGNQHAPPSVNAAEIGRKAEFMNQSHKEILTRLLDDGHSALVQFLETNDFYGSLAEPVDQFGMSRHF